MQYKPETFETLAHQQTIDKLVKVFGYPEVSKGVVVAVLLFPAFCHPMQDPPSPSFGRAAAATAAAANRFQDQLISALSVLPSALQSLYELQFDWRYMTRGLVIDKKRGNMLKVRGAWRACTAPALPSGVSSAYKGMHSKKNTVPHHHTHPTMPHQLCSRSARPPTHALCCAPTPSSGGPPQVCEAGVPRV